MLANTPLVTFIPSKDAARAFFEDTLGLRFLSDDGFAIVMDANGTMLRIANVGEFTPAPFTILGWQVADIEAAVAALTAKGVAFSAIPSFSKTTPASGPPPTGPGSPGFSTPTETPSPFRNTEAVLPPQPGVSGKLRETAAA